MGDKNSSETRVRPLGRCLLMDYAKIDDLLNMLVGIPKDFHFGIFEDANVWFSDNENSRKEISLSPTKQHLKKLLSLIKEDEEFRNEIRDVAIAESSATNEEGKSYRQLLFDCCDECYYDQALEIINTGTRDSKKKWALFEGDSHPDLFIENDKYILLVEGKRTESGTKDSTTYLKNRSQMVRHIQNALAYARPTGKKVIAFYIIEEGCGYEGTCVKQHFMEVINRETIAIDETTKTEIINSFYEFITWKDVSEKLGIAFD
ncbi:MAG: hypothetical protein HUJ70_07450 [Pseudobutyrivibrio sp.]|nr:hypothetical protein [Pseudobutyrivibrio sp.]